MPVLIILSPKCKQKCADTNDSLEQDQPGSDAYTIEKEAREKWQDDVGDRVEAVKVSVLEGS